MKKILGMSLIAATTMAFASTADDIAKLQAEIDKLKVKVGKVNAQSANDNIKWGVDFRTAIDSINYDMADGTSRSKNDLMSMRLWLNMAYAPDSHNVFKGQLSMNKAFGADFGQRNPNFTFGGFDWTANEALTDDTLKVRQAYWLYLGDRAFGLDMPWTFSIGRRPSTNGFLANLRDDDPAQSPLGHIINVEFDGLSSKLDLSNVTGIPGMSIKLCMGQGSTNATSIFQQDGTQYSNDGNNLEDIKLGGFILEPYNDGQIITKFTWFRAYDLPGYSADTIMNPPVNPLNMTQAGDIDGGAFSVLVDGITEDGYFSDVKVFASYAWTTTHPNGDSQMLGFTTSPGAFGPGSPAVHVGGAEIGESKTGTSWWIGTQLPVTEKGKLGLEYNHGSQYWRPFTYAEDTMIGSKLAARGDAYELYFTYQLTDALSAQMRYTKIDYDYTGSNSFFAADGAPLSIDEIKAAAARVAAGTATNPADFVLAQYEANTVESADDFRFYLRYRF